MKKINMIALASTMILFTACGGIDSIAGEDPAVGQTTDNEGNTVNVAELTEKNDVWILQNVNQAEVNKVISYANGSDGMHIVDPTAVSVIANISCNSLVRYSLLSNTSEKLDGGVEALTYYFENNEFSDNNFYCKEYAYPSSSSSYGNLTVAIGVWNDGVDQSEHNPYFSSSY